ncbi:methyltransferase domain-containing protein [candidate division KSB1 bacterium]|nr:methyltransferase domain-containing protein [candidate division KSB1 bacterium]
MASHRQTWENYRKFADERGWLVASILSQFTKLEGKYVLDYGCGDGATSRQLSKMGAIVTAADANREVRNYFQGTEIVFLHSEDEEAQWQNHKFDIVLLQDVLEHLTEPEATIKKIRGSMKPGGLIYISTPNRLSLLNAISDPHWGLPFVSLFSRPFVRFLVKDIFKRDQRERSDWAALVSLRCLKKILKMNRIGIYFMNRFAAKVLFQNPEAVICHPKHFKLVRWIQRHRLERVMQRIVNDRAGFFNYFINPTWYLVGKAR